MFARRHLFLSFVGILLGCNQPSNPDTGEKPLGDPAIVNSQPEEPKTIETETTHIIALETEYYTTGPQQGRSPDGTFPAGTKVTLVEQAGSYSLVNAEDGTQAYIAANALKTMEQDAPSEKDIDAVVSGNNQFALDLYAQLRGEEGNLFFSPHSISTALAMTYAGARGTTETEMAKTLHFNLPQDQLHASFVDVNEEGTEAAAATGIAIEATRDEIIPTFRADHPFVFLIRDNRTDSILFVGRVINPQA